MDYFWAYCWYSGEVDYAGKDGGGFFMTILLGIVGAVVGGWISTLFGFGKVDGFNFGSFVVAVIGALVVLFIYKKSKANAEIKQRLRIRSLCYFYRCSVTTILAQCRGRQ